MIDQVAEVTLWRPPVLRGNIAPRGREALRLTRDAKYPSNRRIVSHNHGRQGPFHDDTAKAPWPDQVGDA
eukprot:6141986-Pyramimonas_sp.AAC.1